MTVKLNYTKEQAIERFVDLDFKSESIDASLQNIMNATHGSFTALAALSPESAIALIEELERIKPELIEHIENMDGQRKDISDKYVEALSDWTI